MAKETLPTWPNGWDENLKLLEWLTDKQKDKILKSLLQEKEDKKNEFEKSIYWNKEAILKNLKENYVKIEENQNRDIYKWKKYHIELPAVWHFKWYKFDCYVSDWFVKKADFERVPWYENMSYTHEELSYNWGLLWAMDRYMKENWVKEEYEAVKNIKAITGLNNRYWLKDCNKEHHLRSITSFGKWEKSVTDNEKCRVKMLLKLSE